MVTRLHGLALAALLGACSDTRCPELERCDVRKSACQKAAMRQAVCLRGRGEDAEREPPVDVITRADYLALVGDGVTESEADNTFRRGLAHFGLYPEEDADPAEAQRASARLVAAYYDDASGRITVVDDGDAMDSAWQTLTLVHEMVHVLQSAAGEFALWYASERFDTNLASRAPVEGEATILTDEAYATGFGFDFAEFAYDRSLANYRGSSLWYASRADYPFDELAMRFSYAYGASYMWPLREARGAAALADAYAVFPNSTRTVLTADPSDPERYPNDLGDDAVPEIDGLEPVGSMHLGGFAYDVFATLRRYAWFGAFMPRASSYRADTLTVLRTPDDDVVSVWRVRFNDANTAQDTAEHLGALLDDLTRDAELSGFAPWTLRVDVLDTDVVLVRADSAEALAGLPPEFTWGAAPEEDYVFTGAEEASARCLVPRP